LPSPSDLVAGQLQMQLGERVVRIERLRLQRNDLCDFGPALLITETCFNAAGMPVIYAIDYHPGSHFSFSLARK
jgi:DNA-binding GntR family transcriptional regulator